MIALLKYACGLPFHRIEKLQKNLGIPLPAATQWELVSAAAAPLKATLHELIREAAQGEVVHNDDTTMKLLSFGTSPFPEDEPRDGRTGVYTTGIVSRLGAHDIALYFTGRQHAGENLARVLAERAAALPPPIQMCDALSHNTAGEFETIVANCIAHARRQFVEVAPSFPEQCRYVLEALREVYRNDATARAEQMSPEKRLAFHQQHSGPPIRGLQWWLHEQLALRKVEPNSTLGGAVNYMLKHWKKLTLFLDEPGAPLDNNTAYAGPGITQVMPRPGLCRVGVRKRGQGRGIPGPWRNQSRHNDHRLLRNVSRLSDGRNRAGLAPEGSA